MFIEVQVGETPTSLALLRYLPHISPYYFSSKLGPKPLGMVLLLLLCVIVLGEGLLFLL